MKTLIINSIIFLLIIIIAIFAYFKIALAVDMSASVEQSPVRACIDECIIKYK